MATVSVTGIEAAVSRANNVETGVVRATKVAVKNVNKKTVKIGSNIFTKTNFYIQQSQRYFSNRKLTRYWYIP